MPTPRRPVALAALLSAALACAHAGPGGPPEAARQPKELRFRSFSPSAAIGPPALEYAAKLQRLSSLVLGEGGALRFTALPGVPPIPPAFGGDVVAAVAAGASGGGFDAAYTSGSELNKAWGFLYNSGFPFGPTFDEFLGFLYGKSLADGRTGLELAQALLEKRGVVAFPIVGSPEQLSGYFPEPIGDAPGARGIGLAGLCQKRWTLRYLPPGENVLEQACSDLVAQGAIPAKALGFIAAIPGGGSLVQAVKSGALQGFEFATPLDDVSQLFQGQENPGTVGVRYVHLPGWQQQFLVTWMLVNRAAWDALTPAQQALAQSVARDHLVSSYGENLRQQGPALAKILGANRTGGDAAHGLVLVEWPARDQQLLRDATFRFLTARGSDPRLPAQDRADFVTVRDALRAYVQAGDFYWDRRAVPTQLRFEGWLTPGAAPQR
jgi:hypothetical protein